MFQVWLNSRLKEMKVDENVFGDYIEGIVNSDDDFESKKTALNDLLMDLLEEEVLFSFYLFLKSDKVFIFRRTVLKPSYKKF